MASSSKPTGVHFALIFFVMATLILGLVTYLTAKEYYAATGKLREESDNASQATTALNNALSDIESLKNGLGYQFDSVGAGGAGENSVMSAMLNDLNSYGREEVAPNPQNPTVAGTLQSLRAALDAANQQIATLQTGLQSTEDRLAQETTMHRDRAQQLATSQQDSESQLQKLVTDRDELLAQKDSEINKWREAFQNEQVEKEKLRDELERVRKDLEGKIAEFETTVQFLRQRLNAVENMSFDKPDGKIVRINNTTRDVWIDLGSADNLRKQVGFSVYIQSHSGVGRGTGDIKAKVEVTEIRGPHTAICKILDDDISRPIQEGDPIYSPLWEKGAQELFSFAGILDMNSDGESDRELLHNVLDNAGAGIEVELNDQGIREPADGRVTVRSKFFVVGEAPDPTKFAGFSEKQAEMKRVLEELNALEKEALRSGVRIVRFKDFLNYIGHEPQQRLFVAGQERPFNLKSGARSTGVDEVLGGNRASTGQTSSRFRNDRRPGQDSSNGTTSELFRQ